MARDYYIESLISYHGDGGRVVVTDNPTVYGSSATDDGFWNLGDPLIDGAPNVTFAGHYFEGGDLFLVFDNPNFGAGGHTIVSPTAATTSSGYPTNYASDPPPTLVTTPLATCFAAGTLITTPVGSTAVEDLRNGDPILTASGDTVRVKWIGRQTLHRLSHGHHMQPVRIRAGALGDGLPHTDLTTTAEHGMILDGCVINAGALVNGATIDWVPLSELPDSFIVYHVETENHDVILANGAAAETFIDYVGRQAFDNYAEYVDLFGDDRTIVEMPLPRISAARLVPQSIRMRLDGRARQAA